LENIEMKVLLINDYDKHGGAEEFCHLLINGLIEKGHEAKLLTPETGMNISLDADLIHFNNVCRVGLEPLKFCQREKLPYIWTSHDYYFVCKRRTRILEDGRMCNVFDWRNCNQCKHQLSSLPNPDEIRR